MHFAFASQIQSSLPTTTTSIMPARSTAALTPEVNEIQEENESILDKVLSIETALWSLQEMMAESESIKVGIYALQTDLFCF